MLVIVALLIIVSAILPWDVGSSFNAVKAVWSWFWPGLVHISTSPIQDWRAAIDRFLLAVGVILLVASLWSPLPASTTDGSWAALRQAIEDYQGAHGLGVDGIWGPNTDRSFKTGK